MNELDINFDNNLNNKFIFEYWKTLERKNISNITTSKFLKKPYIENYIIHLSCHKNKIEDKIIELIKDNIINTEDILLFIKNNYEFTVNEKKNIENYFLKNNFDDSSLYSISISIIHYQIEYFRFYQLVVELLFENEDENNELYNFILIYFKNNKSYIKRYKNKNFKFNLFFEYLNNLSKFYIKIYHLLYEYKFIPENNNLSIHNLFLKNLFTNWYNIYKNDILENKVNEKIKDYRIERSILSKILCLPNV